MKLISAENRPLSDYSSKLREKSCTKLIKDQYYFLNVSVVYIFKVKTRWSKKNLCSCRTCNKIEKLKNNL